MSSNPTDGVRDEFLKSTRDALRHRVNGRCSNPECRQPTSGPREDPEKALDIGVSAHICAAAAGGPRFDVSMTSEQRVSIENGIWLCQNCAKLVDNDAIRFTADLLRKWKADAEARALAELHGTTPSIDYRADWERITSITRASFANVRDSIGGLIRLSRDRDAEKLHHALRQSSGVVLLGPTGVGKSAVAKREAEQRLADGRRCVWFSARSFERLDFIAFQADLQLEHPLSELFGAPTPWLDEAVLFIDGLDRLYDEEAFTLVGAMVNALGLTQDACRWRVVITCQTEEWQRLQPKLLRVDIPASSWRLVECEPVALEALEPVWKGIPKAAPLKYQPNLRSLLVNLKILDLIAARILAGGDVETAGWVGESSVATWYWDSEIAIGRDANARARFTMLLGERQADTLRPGVPLTSFDVAELAPFDGLVRDRVCHRTSKEQVVFAHDLLGDWARLRVLLARADDLVPFLKERLSLPLWHRAVRLYGVRLLEHTNDVAQWRTLRSALAGVAGAAAADLLLEALIFAANPRPLLEALREDLMAGDGELLRRLLGRFLFFATIPNPTTIALARTQGWDTTSIAATIRYPIWIYWPPILQFLSDHGDAVIRAAPDEVSRAIELWLKYAPEKFPLRKEVAALGLRLGEGILQLGAYGADDHDYPKRCYRVALLAAAEMPDEAASFALRACQRSHPDDGAMLSAAEPSVRGRSNRRGLRQTHVGTTLGPWPDGPRDRVSQDFQDTVLDSDALLPLIRERPAVAREVVLASLLKPPRPYDANEHWHEQFECEVDSKWRWHPALYVNGPFLAFLNSNFGEGLETVARLVDFATERLQSEEGPNSQPHGIDEAQEVGESASIARGGAEQAAISLILPLPKGDRCFVGRASVYGWSAGLGNSPSAIEVALMALEQHFYLEIEGSRSVEAKVEAVLDRVRSTAFLKVLCDVGKREVSLFEGPLRPLLAVPEIYHWEIEATSHGRSGLMMGAEARHGGWFARMAEAFHSMEHRSKDLRDVAAEVFLQGKPATRQFLSDVRQRWEQQIEGLPTGPDRDFLQQLAVSFDIANYRRFSHPQRGEVIVNVRARELQAQRADELKRMEEDAFLIMLPFRCRSLIDKQAVMVDADLESFWERVQQISRRQSVPSVAQEPSAGSVVALESTIERILRPITSPVGSPLNASSAEVVGHEASGASDAEVVSDRGKTEAIANGLVGAAAFFVLRQDAWLEAHPGRRQWCLEQLRSVIVNPPSPDRSENGRGVSRWTWDCFAAEAIAVLWAKQSGDRELRRLVAQLVMASHNVAVEFLFERCGERRKALGDDFRRLRRLLFEFAHVRNRISFVDRVRCWPGRFSEEQARRFVQAVSAWVHDCVAAFVEGELSSTCEPWRAADAPGRFSEVDEMRRKSEEWYYLDFELIRSGHMWLPLLDQAQSPQERREWMDFWRSALEFVLVRVEKHPGRDSHPYESDHWVLAGVAAILMSMGPHEKPEDLWRVVLGLPGSAHDWVEDFLGYFHRVGLRQNPTPESFASMRAAMIEYAFARQSAGYPAPSAWPYFEDVWTALIGIDVITRGCWEERHRGIVEQSRPLLERWVRGGGRYGRHLAVFASWLECDAAGSIRPFALVWLDEALTVGDVKRASHREDAADAVASLLNVAWTRDELRLRQDAVAFAAFRRLLQWLADEQNPLALSVVAQLGRNL